MLRIRRPDDPHLAFHLVRVRSRSMAMLHLFLHLCDDELDWRSKRTHGICTVLGIGTAEMHTPLSCSLVLP